MDALPGPKPAKSSRPRQKRERLFLSRRDEEILKTAHVYRFLTARDIAARLFSPRSETYVRKLLLPLCGGADAMEDHYLYRFPLPHVGPGNSERVFTLGSRGREFLASEVGWPVPWYFRPQKVKNASFASLMHSLLLTRILVAAEHFARHCPTYQLVHL